MVQPNNEKSVGQESASLIAVLNQTDTNFVISDKPLRSLPAVTFYRSDSSDHTDKRNSRNANELEQGMANFFCKWPESKYFQYCGLYSLFHKPFAAQKPPQTKHKPMGVALCHTALLTRTDSSQMWPLFPDP